MQELLSGTHVGHIPRIPTLYRFQLPGLQRVVGRPLDQWLMVALPMDQGYPVEKAACNSGRSIHMGGPLGPQMIADSQLKPGGGPCLAAWGIKAKGAHGLGQSTLFTAATNNFTVNLQHIEGANNSIADALSHSQFCRFHSLAPGADADPTPIPAIMTQWLHYLQDLGMAPSTKCTYLAAVCHFMSFRQLYDIRLWLASELTLRYYCAHAGRSVSHSTIPVGITICN